MTQITRRHFLRTTGITLALPWLEAFAQRRSSRTIPRRFCAIYFPFGVSLPGPNHPDSKWNWFPFATGPDYQFNESLKSLEPLRDRLTLLSGLHHPAMAGGGGHDSADTFLTGASLSSGHLKNTVSVDQIMAKHLGRHTRYRSLTLSTDGGVGVPMRSNTLSYSEDGLPIPSLNRPAYLFERLFGLDEGNIEAQRRRLSIYGSHLDLLRDETRSLEKRLGRADRERLDQYLTSVRQVESQVQTSTDWLEVPKPKVNADGLTLDADDNTPKELIRTMLDLIVLAFQTDSTRIVSYQLANMHGGTSIAMKFPKLLGFRNSTHGLAHDWNKPGGAEQLGKWDQWQTQNLHYFLEKLSATPEGEGTLLDNTLVYYGSSNSVTHVNRNYPLILAGGESMGFKHGSHVSFSHETPLSNLYLTVLQQLGVPQSSFADSTGTLDGLLV